MENAANPKGPITAPNFQKFDITLCNDELGITQDTSREQVK